MQDTGEMFPYFPPHAPNPTGVTSRTLAEFWRDLATHSDVTYITKPTARSAMHGAMTVIIAVFYSSTRDLNNIDSLT